ncbi:hypothetical protein HMPREF9370_1560 [Neisseria wadsworthii 9715]|uniref:Uncharacterized protein n=2 Tax=Neisseria TaxID=482 RepID=G4CR50_9NEIS|nr:hypothetical protein HMPREF9370_1560 [Neisseria wadsworthii 9715]
MAKYQILSRYTDSKTKPSKTKPRWKRKWQAWLFFIALNSWNGFMTWIVSKQYRFIYGDGPVGFIEMMIKVLIFSLSEVIFMLAIIFVGLSLIAYPEKRHIKKVWFMTTCLSAFGFLMIDEACSNTVGFCQKWRLIW